MATDKEQLHQLGRFTFNVRQYTLRDNHTGSVQPLTSITTRILRTLCTHKNGVVRRDVLIHQIWGGKVDRDSASRRLDVFVHKLRGYIQSDPSLRIQTLRGIGLKLVEENAEK
ncbi:MAG: helix-turn-helix domain-containing protein [Mediterranea sp.]|jgi:DNA-binding response OmpR family regulator|nr:helix-turn-helix domain-containing protein [Mediterranea sp.]